MSVPLDQQVTLEVTVSGDGASVPAPAIPSLPNFSIYEGGKSQQVSITNGRIHAAVTYRYSLVPRFVGKALIGSITVESGGERAQTAPIEIVVERPGQSARPAAPQQSQPAAAAGEGPDLFVEASVDKPRAYVNEQITLSVRLHVAVSLMGNPDYQAPDTSGFFREDLPPLRSYQRPLHGRQYYVTEVKSALFAAAPGTYELGEAVIIASVPSDRGLDPFAPFERFLTGRDPAEKVKIQSRRIKVEILPLPAEGRPAGFNGAVGSYRLSSSFSREKARVGDPLELSVLIEGTGNLKTVAAPTLPELKAFRVYDTLSSIDLVKEKDVVRGSKTFKTVLVPRASGLTRLPPISFSFFDPAQGAYRTASAAPLQVSVDPADESRPPAVIGGSPLAPAAAALESDIRFLREAPMRSAPSAALARAGRAAALLWLPPCLWLLAAGAWGKRRWTEGQDPAALRSRRAAAAARARVAEARREADGAKGAAAVGDAVTAYCADRLRVSRNGLTLKTAAAGLQRAGASPGSLAQLDSLWRSLEALRYAPAASVDRAEVEALAARAESLVSSLEKELK